MPDSGQKTLPLMHQLKAQAGIVEPRRDRADSELHLCNMHCFSIMLLLRV